MGEILMSVCNSLTPSRLPEEAERARHCAAADAMREADEVSACCNAFRLFVPIQRMRSVLVAMLIILVPSCGFSSVRNELASVELESDNGHRRERNPWS
eukprot:3882409-Amphidinium_carterae.1